MLVLEHDTLVELLGHPWVLTHLLAVESHVGVSHQDLLDEILGLLGHAAPGVYVEVILASLDLLEECEVIFLVEWGSSREKDESNDTDAPEVASLSVRLLLEHLWGDVSRSSACCLQRLSRRQVL